jgi:hypothetical protein
MQKKKKGVTMAINQDPPTGEIPLDPWYYKIRNLCYYKI